ncbi:MAG: hypothetical protein VKK97_10125 [Synechococcaceae cyanobacterium]|nr:hypothetical protein [Synechococcaceae cyanobacterium]
MDPTLIDDELPGPGDRDLDGRCWWGHGLVYDPYTAEPYQPCWSLSEEPSGADTHWLPADARPVPHGWPLRTDEDLAADDDGREALTAAERNPSLCR